MQETWLRPNRRALWLGTVPPLVATALGAWIVFRLGDLAGGWSRWMGWLMIIFGLSIVAAIGGQLRRPRLAYRPGELLLFVRSGGPIAVPVHLVDDVRLAAGPTGLPLAGRSRTKNLIIRLRPNEPDWAARTVNPSLANWQDGCITLHGTWCEPLNEQLVRRLNDRLREVAAPLDTTDVTPS